MEGNRSGSQMVALRFVGGNRRTAATREWSNQDGYGTMVEAVLGDRVLHREHRAGEGLAAQNSATLILGVGAREAVDSLVIRWPSGRVQTVDEVPVGTLVSVYEDPSQSPTGKAFVIEPYSTQAMHLRGSAYTTLHRGLDVPWPVASRQGDDARDAELAMYTTFATWCDTCRAELPQLELLRTVFGPNELDMFGVPYDEKETPAKLEAWANAFSPPYELLSNLGEDRIRSVQDYVRKAFKLDGIPASVVTARDGRVLLRKWGPPTVSELRALLEQMREGHS